MRHLVVRTGYHTDEMMIIFVTNGKVATKMLLLRRY